MRFNNHDVSQEGYVILNSLTYFNILPTLVE